MAERGVWNAGPDLDWLAGLKLNFSRSWAITLNPSNAEKS